MDQYPLLRVEVHDTFSKIICCSFFFNFKVAFWVSNSDFLKVLTPLKPEKITCSKDIFLFSVSEFESAKLAPL